MPTRWKSFISKKYARFRRARTRGLPDLFSEELQEHSLDSMSADMREEAGGRVHEATRSPFLALPSELRLSIYEFALLDSPCVTVGHAWVTGKHADVIHFLYGEDRTPYPGLPENHTPMISPFYHPALLSIAHQGATIPATLKPQDTIHKYSTHQSLLLVNHQIREELTSHFLLPKNKQTSIFASYPYGLHILKTSAPRLLGQAKSVHIAGKYTSSTFTPARAACTPRPTPEEEPIKHHGAITPNATHLLGQLVASTFGPNPIHRIQKLEMRIYYPGDDSYSTVWGDDDSPTVVALRNISNAEVGIEVWRGAKGTGIYLIARPARERKRVVSTVWRKLEEGRRGQPEVGSWVVDPKWPRWSEEYDMSEGPQGNVFTSTPVDRTEGGASATW